MEKIKSLIRKYKFQIKLAALVVCAFVSGYCTCLLAI